MASHSFESDSGGEHASTNDDVASSHQWTTDFDDDDDDSETGDENRGGDETKTDSGDDDESDGGYEKVVHHHHKSSVLSNSENCRSKKAMRRINHLDNGSQKPQVQSDTETRNLLDDIGDFDDDCLDLQEAETSFNVDQQNYVIDPVMFELSEEQHDYYVKCFLYLLEKTQGCASVNGALNGSDIRVIEFFRKSQLDNSVLSRIWALSDVNEDGFLNLSEFIVAMHLIILYLKGNVPIPVHLPVHVRPPATPTRHLIRMANGCFSTSLHSTASMATAVTEDVYSTTTTSASSNSTTNVGGGDNTSRGSSNSQHRQHNQQQQQYYDLVSSRYSNSTSNNGRLRQLPSENAGGCYSYISDAVQTGTPGGMDCADASASYALMYAAAGNGDPPDPNSTGVKQHSLSDDHLHIHAQREIGIAKFSDVPPVLVDSHPTALNAATSLGVGLAGGLLNGFATSASRGPPPEPPARDYNAAGGGKGHGRSASLDLKTFAALSSYPPKSPHLNSRLSRKESLIQQQQQPAGCLATLNEDLSQVALSAAEQYNVIRREQSTQTDPSTDSTTATTAQLLTDYDEIFSSAGGSGGDIYSMTHSGEERCRLLRRLNDQLENERVTLAQVRLQLQLRIEEAQQELERQQQSTETRKAMTVDGSVTTAGPLPQIQQKQPQLQTIKPKPTAV